MNVVYREKEVQYILPYCDEAVESYPDYSDLITIDTSSVNNTVPEPSSTILLIALVCVVLVVLRRR